MGGCRCYYRNCKVNTSKFPGMHFFRFPLRHPQRCELWIKYSQQFDFPTLPLVRQKNMAICARHFKDECFMNYKKDRLMPAAVPTIHRLSPDKALDFETDIDHGVLVTLPKVEKSHLIPPAGFVCTLGFGYDVEVIDLLRSLENDEGSAYPEKTNDEVEIVDAITNDLNLFSKQHIEILDTIEISPDRGEIKRSAQCLLSDETSSDVFNESAKRLKSNIHIEDEHTSIPDDTIEITGASDTTTRPTILNHQIMDADGNLWLPSETFSLQDEYQFVEIQTQPEHSDSEQVHEIPEKLHDETNNVPLTDDLQLLHKLEEASIEINDLRVQLKTESKKVKKLESNLSSSRMSIVRSTEQEERLKVKNSELETANEQLEVNLMQAEIYKLQLEEEKEERAKLEKELEASKQECAKTKGSVDSLQIALTKIQSENDDLKNCILNMRKVTEKETKLRQEYDQQLQSEQLKHSEIEQQLQQQITILEQSLELAQQQLTETKNNLSTLKTECTYLKNDRLSSVQKLLASEGQLEKLQEQHDNKEEQCKQLESICESLQKSNEKLKADNKMLESCQNQVSTVTTSNNSALSRALPQQQPAQAATVTSLTKAQLFNGIKRYISSSMSSLLRMEMFGSSEREWKPDERQIAVDLLRLGEFVYKYLTDEWRFRLPALREARNWLNQSVVLDDEEDL